MTNAREMKPEYVQIRSDIQRWISDNDGNPALRRLDTPRLTAIINQCVANNPDVNSTTIWRLLTPHGTDIALINRQLAKLIP